MHPRYQSILTDIVGPSIEAVHSQCSDGQKRIGVLMGSGHGDNARGLALCNALRSVYPTGHIFAVMQFSGTMIELDMLHLAQMTGIVNAGVPAEAAPFKAMVHFLTSRFDVLYDARPYAVGVFYNCSVSRPDRRIQVREQAVATARLSLYASEYSEHPLGWWRLKFDPVSQWEIMSQTAGVHVDESDLNAPLELAPLPENCPEKLKNSGKVSFRRALRGIEGTDYVVVHNSAGQLSATKVAPAHVFEAIVQRLAAMGVRSVQVGPGDEEVIAGAEDRTGYRLPVTNKLIDGALCLVDVEGFLPYMAAALDTPAAVLFGPTLEPVFGMPQNLNLVRRDPERGRAPCPVGTCFWGGGIFPAEKWASRCPLGKRRDSQDKAINPSYPHCQNFKEPDEAAGEVEALVKRLLAERTEGRA